MNRYRKSLAVIMMCLMTMMLSACSVSEGGIKESQGSSNPYVTTNNESGGTNKQQTGSGKSEVEVQFIDIGQGDSILVRSDGQTMLVDAGNNEYGEGLVTYLKGQGVSKIDYLIGTHPDADHIGGLDIVINKLDIGKVYMPKKQNNTKTFEDVLTAISKKGLKVTAPKVGASFTVGKATVTILGPIQSYEDNNNNSIVLKVEHGNNSFLLMGDAELEAEEDMVAAGEDLSATVLKIGHHGSHSSTSQSLLKKVNPTYAVISCALGNSYGHPHKETMTYLNRANVTIYRTDTQQTITMNSNGKKITVQTNGGSVASSKTGTSSGSSTGKNNTAKKDTSSTSKPEAQTKAAYIGNKNTKKFHRTTCSSLPEKQNQVEFKTRKEALNAGYDPCGRCNP